MRETTLGQIADWCGGRLVQGRPADTISVVSTDSRSLKGGELFVALKGDRFDGHKFIDQVSDAGVAAVMVSQLNLASERFEGGIIHVSNTLVALQELALRYRRALSDLFVVGVTGSNGKTSTKDFLAAVMSRSGAVNATKGNLNNHIGLPLTILETGAVHEVGVWEMGMSNPGEIEVLAEIAGPDAAVITNVGTAHIEHMKTREAIRDEKGMLAEAIGPEGVVILNANDDASSILAERCQARVVTAGIDAGEVQAGGLRTTTEGIAFTLSSNGESVPVQLSVAGAHMAGNAALAAAAGIERGLSLSEIAEALNDASLAGGRLERRRLGGVEFLDDSYNANPDSMRAALKTLAEIETQGRRIAVLGRMAELGESEEAEHEALGQAVGEAGIDILLAVGNGAEVVARGAEAGVGQIFQADDHESAAAKLRELCGEGDLVLVKGSRSSAMEKIITAFDTATATD